ncbi:MAG: cation:proton antiporter [Chitinophagaceae bacterium]
MDSYVVYITIIGLAALGMAWMPSITRRTGISYSLIYVLIGMVLYAVLDLKPLPNPMEHQVVTLHLTELVVIVSLMGTGIKIDQPFSLKTWGVPFRLVTVAMLLCIAAIALLAYYILGFDIGTSILLGAVLAPTDPVLASDVQVGPPLEKKENRVRFSITAEAGLNDGMAFTFTWLAVVVAAAMSLPSGFGFSEFSLWMARDVIYKIAAGVTCGVLLGRILAYLIFKLPQKLQFILIRDGFVGIAATLLVYGITELLQGYGFFAVFVAAITLRNFEIGHNYHKKLHDFTDQIERILVAIVLILFGGSLVNGILNYLTWPMAMIGVAFVIIIRPLSGLISLAGSELHTKEKLAVSFFGIRGIGSFFYLSFALQQTYFEFGKELWSIVSFIVILSLILHGFTATSTMEKIVDKPRRQETAPE